MFGPSYFVTALGVYKIAYFKIYFLTNVFLTLGMLLKLWLKRADFVTDLTNKFLIGMFSKEMRPHFLLFNYFLTVATWWGFLWMNIVMFSKADSIRKGHFTAFKRTRGLEKQFRHSFSMQFHMQFKSSGHCKFTKTQVAILNL